MAQSRSKKPHSGYTLGGAVYGVVAVLFWIVGLATGWIDGSKVDVALFAVFFPIVTVVLFMGVGAVLGAIGEALGGPMRGALAGGIIAVTPSLLAYGWDLYEYWNDPEKSVPVWIVLLGCLLLFGIGAIPGALGGASAKKQKNTVWRAGPSTSKSHKNDVDCSVPVHRDHTTEKKGNDSSQNGGESKG
jgi:hypothetical protein